jgi:hypothetical protein
MSVNRNVTVPDGSAVVIRGKRPSDEDALQEHYVTMRCSLRPDCVAE